MKKFLIVGFAATALFGAQAMAAEMPLKAAPLLFDWTGWYVGGNGGYSWGHDREHFTTGGTTTYDQRRKYRGGEGSVEGGYCIQSTDKVGCLEVRYDFPGERGRVSTTNPLVPLDTDGKNDPFLIGPKLGFLTDANHMFWYAAGGLAIGKFSVSSSIPGDTSSGHASKWKDGWYIGAGIERMIDQHWSWKIEYDYLVFGGGLTETLSACTVRTVACTTPVLQTRVGNDNVISVGLNYHFGSH